MTQPHLKICDDFLNQKQRTFDSPLVAYMMGTLLVVQSMELLEKTGIPMFAIHISETLRFEAFHCGVKCYIKSLVKLQITELNSWSVISEVITRLSKMAICPKKQTLINNINGMTPRAVGEKHDLPCAIVKAFEIFATSRACYNRLLSQQYALPSVGTLTKITSKVAKLNENLYLGTVFKSLKTKLCLILHDEIYIKKMVLYHCGTLFGKSVDQPDMLVHTMQGVIIICFFGGPKFLSKD